MFDKDVEKIATRVGFGEGLVLAGEKNPDVVALCADLVESTRMDGFQKKFHIGFNKWHCVHIVINPHH